MIQRLPASQVKDFSAKRPAATPPPDQPGDSFLGQVGEGVYKLANGAAGGAVGGLICASGAFFSCVEVSCSTVKTQRAIWGSDWPGFVKSTASALTSTAAMVPLGLAPLAFGTAGVYGLVKGLGTGFSQGAHVAVDEARATVDRLPRSL